MMLTNSGDGDDLLGEDAKFGCRPISSKRSETITLNVAVPAHSASGEDVGQERSDRAGLPGRLVYELFSERRRCDA
jgi:hypothetical protein